MSWLVVNSSQVIIRTVKHIAHGEFVKVVNPDVRVGERSSNMGALLVRQKVVSALTCFYGNIKALQGRHRHERLFKMESNIGVKHLSLSIRILHPISFESHFHLHTIIQSELPRLLVWFSLRWTRVRGVPSIGKKYLQSTRSCLCMTSHDMLFQQR